MFSHDPHHTYSRPQTSATADAHALADVSIALEKRRQSSTAVPEEDVNFLTEVQQRLGIRMRTRRVRAATKAPVGTKPMAAYLCVKAKGDESGRGSSSCNDEDVAPDAADCGDDGNLDSGGDSL